MSKHDIENLRHKLNHLIEFGCSYEEIYNVSIELDELIIAFYKEQNETMLI